MPKSERERGHACVIQQVDGLTREREKVNASQFCQKWRSEKKSSKRSMNRDCTVTTENRWWWAQRQRKKSRRSDHRHIGVTECTDGYKTRLCAHQVGAISSEQRRPHAMRTRKRKRKMVRFYGQCPERCHRWCSLSVCLFVCLMMAHIRE